MLSAEIFHQVCYALTGARILTFFVDNHTQLDDFHLFIYFYFIYFLIFENGNCENNSSDFYFLTLKTPRKPASENVVCSYCLLHLLANFSNIRFEYRQTVWAQIRLLLEEQSDLGPHCLQQ